MKFWKEVWEEYKTGIASKIFWPFWAWMVFAFVFVLTAASIGCTAVEVEEPEPTFEPSEEAPAIEEPAAPAPEEPPVADVPVDRAGRPMVDAEGNEIPIEEREAPEQ